MTTINRRSLAPLHCASTDSTHFNINALHFTEEGQTIGTDGHLMAVFTPPAPPQAPDRLQPFTLEAEHLKALNKEQRKRFAPLAEIDRLATNANGHCRIETAGSGAVEIPKLQGTYPDWKQVIPSDPPAFAVHLSLEILEKMIATVRQFTETRKGEACPVRLDFQEAEENGECLRPVVVTRDHANEDGDTLRVIMMPCRK